MATQPRLLRVSGKVVDGVVVWHHALVEEAGDQDAVGLLAVEDDVSALFHAPKAGPNFIAGTARLGVFGEALAACFDFAEITVGLRGSPGAKGVLTDAEQI